MRPADVVRIAADAGHRLALEERPSPVAGGNDKWWAVCSCGWSSTARLSVVAVRTTGGRHLVRAAEAAVAEAAAEDRRRRVAALLHDRGRETG